MTSYNWEKRNREFLTSYDPYVLLEADGATETDVVAQINDAGLPVVFLRGEPLHDPVDPKGEAAQEIGVAPHLLHLHFGFGSGWYLDADRPMDSGRTLVFEPEPAVFRAALTTCHLERIYSGKRARVCCTWDRFRYLAMRLFPMAKGYRLFISRRHAALFPEELARFSQFLQSLNAVMSRANSSFLLPTIIRSTMASLPHHLAADDVALWRNRLQGKPAIIVAAGPSLDNNLEQLKAMRNKVVLFALGRTAKALAGMGISPDFLVHVEAQDFISFIQDCDNLKHTHFLLADQAHPAYYRFPHGRTYVFQSRTNAVINSLVVQNPGVRREIVKTGGSVATAAYYLAWLFGCNPLIVIGQDLSLTDGRWYGGEGNQQKQQRGHRMVPGFWGGTVPTTPNFHNNIIWYQQAVAVMHTMDSRRIFLNCTEGGARLAGMTHLSLAEAAETYLRQDPVTVTPPPATTPRIEPQVIEELQHEMQQFIEDLREQNQIFTAWEEELLTQLALGQQPLPATFHSILQSFIDLFEAKQHRIVLLKAEHAAAQLLQQRAANDDDLIPHQATLAVLHHASAQWFGVWQ